MGSLLTIAHMVRAGTTFNDYYSQKKDATHFTGFNMGNYDLPVNSSYTM